MIKGNKHVCWYCGQKEQCTKDHFIPKSKGGKVTVYACSVCQGSKRDLMPLDWMHNMIKHTSITDAAKLRIVLSVTSLNDHINMENKINDQFSN